MNKLTILGIVLVNIYASLAAPAFAQPKADQTRNLYAQREVCGPHDPGNPYNKETDYWDWSSWRARGGWDARNDFKCTPGRGTR